MVADPLSQVHQIGRCRRRGVELPQMTLEILYGHVWSPSRLVHAYAHPTQPGTQRGKRLLVPGHPPRCALITTPRHVQRAPCARGEPDAAPDQDRRGNALLIDSRT